VIITDEYKKRATALIHSVHNLYKSAISKLDPKWDAEAKKFLADRQIDPKLFGVGYARYDTISHVCDELPGEDVELLVELGLLFHRKDDVVDKFRNRIIFPVYDQHSKLVGFTGRIVKGNGPKWLDIRESFYYNKNSVVFNLENAKEAARLKDLFILVEGALDVHALVKEGLNVTVAPMGTYLTKRQVQIMRRYASRIILLMDPDEAGEKVIKVAMKTLSSQGFKIAVAHLPTFDPDQTIREQGVSVIFKALKEASEQGFKAHGFR